MHYLGGGDHGRNGLGGDGPLGGGFSLGPALPPNRFTPINPILSPNPFAPSSDLMPEFYQATGSIPLFTPWLGAQVAVSLTTNPFAVYVGIGPSAGYPSNYGANATANYAVTWHAPSQQYVERLLTGSSYTFGGSFIYAAPFSYSPGTGGWTVGGGLGFRGLNGGYTYSWRIYP